MSLSASESDQDKIVYDLEPDLSTVRSRGAVKKGLHGVAGAAEEDGQVQLSTLE